MTGKSLVIKKIADAISSQYSEKETPLEKIVEEEEGLFVFYDNYGENSFDGMTVYDNGNYFIHLNIDTGNAENSAKGRFTLGHELGHYFIDSHRNGLKSGLLKPHPSKTNKSQFFKIERQADYFSGCLLMPEGKFLKDIKRQKFSHELLDFLRKEYNVSRTACAFRFADIGNHPLMIMFAENNIIKWRHFSENFPFKYFLNDNIVPENTVMGEYFSGVNFDAFTTEKIWAMDCFKYVKEYDIKRQFYEYCITYKNFALSLFWED